MTIDQLRDELAGLQGHTPLAGSDGWYRNPVTGHTYPHPVTLTLDWLAAHGLPEGWKWHEIGEDRVGNWGAMVIAKCVPVYGDAPTELHARLAACVAAWKATKGTQ